MALRAKTTLNMRNVEVSRFEHSWTGCPTNRTSFTFSSNFLLHSSLLVAKRFDRALSVIKTKFLSEISEQLLALVIFDDGSSFGISEYGLVLLLLAWVSLSVSTAYG